MFSLYVYKTNKKALRLMEGLLFFGKDICQLYANA